MKVVQCDRLVPGGKRFTAIMLTPSSWSKVAHSTLLNNNDPGSGDQSDQLLRGAALIMYLCKSNDNVGPPTFNDSSSLSLLSMEKH